MNPKYYLGKLCPQGHDYRKTGKSLRNKYHQCMACHREINQKHYQTNKKETCQRHSAYRATKEGYKRSKISNQKSKLKHIISIRKRYYKRRKNLTDSAVRQALGCLYKLPSNQISDTLIKMKREQLTFYRELRRIKKWVSSAKKSKNFGPSVNVLIKALSLHQQL